MNMELARRSRTGGQPRRRSLPTPEDRTWRSAFGVDRRPRNLGDPRRARAGRATAARGHGRDSARPPSHRVGRLLGPLRSQQERRGPSPRVGRHHRCVFHGWRCRAPRPTALHHRPATLPGRPRTSTRRSRKRTQRSGLAQADLGRATRLLAADAVSRSDVDRLRAKVQARGRAGRGECAGAGARARPQLHPGASTD